MRAPANAALLSIRRSLLAVAIGAAALWPARAVAHVKWFCSIADVSAPPDRLSSVLTPLFFAVLCVFGALLFVGFLADGWAARRWPALASTAGRFARLEEALMRLAIGAFFLLLWDHTATVFWETGNAILTPELASQAHWVGFLQFGVAAFVPWRRTCVVSALLIAAIYGFGIYDFGVFHMTDYVFFIGMAGYLALTSVGSPRASRLRVPLLAATLAFSLMWTAVEKFVYPEWTLTVIFEYPAVAFGFPYPFVTVVAGFVEFTLAFFLVTGRGLLRVGAAAYMFIFLIAIPTFGRLDAVGHITIVAILAVICLSGATPLQNSLRVSRRGLVVDAGAVSLMFLATLTMMIAMYYGLQWAEYG